MRNLNFNVMISMNHEKTRNVFVAGPGFDLEATIRLAFDCNAILVMVKPNDVINQILIDQIRKKTDGRQELQ